MTAGKTVLVVHPGAELFGSDRMALESVIGFIDAGARVVVALPEKGPLVVELTHAGAEVVIIPMLVLRKALLRPSGWMTLFRNAFRGLGSAWRLIDRVRPDAVYVSTVIIPQWPTIARLHGVRAISHVHEAEASGSRLMRSALYLPQLMSQRVIANSRFTRETVATVSSQLGRRAEVIYNGVTAPNEPSSPRESIDGALRVLYVGRLSPRKGPDLVIEAASALAGSGRAAQVTLVGAVYPGYEWYETDLRRQAAHTGIEIDFAGFHPSVWSSIAACDVLVVPSRDDESFGNTAVEGVLALRPVIASDSSGLREAAGDYASAQLVPVDDARAIATALERLVDNWPETRGQLGADRAKALRRHSLKAYRRAIANVVLTDPATSGADR